MAKWVIVNDDGTTEIYKPFYEDSYRAPIESIDIPKKDQKSKPLKIKSKPKSKKIIYLTFDDGPLLGSDNIISVLKEEGVKATMFMVGKHIQKSKFKKEIFKRAIKEPLILVANHTYSHADGKYRKFYSDEDRVILDMQKMDDILLKHDLNYIAGFCRLAGRNVFRLPDINHNDPAIPKKYNESKKYDTLWSMGYYIFGWDYQWSYSHKNGEVYNSPYSVVDHIESMYRRGKTKKEGKFILLMHDFSFRDKFNGKENLKILIQELKSLGWKFETIETYI